MSEILTVDDIDLLQAAMECLYMESTSEPLGYDAVCEKLAAMRCAAPDVQGESASGVVPSRDDLIQCLLATRGQSEGATADAILSMLTAAPAVRGEPIAGGPLHPSQVRTLRRNVKRNCPPEIYALLDQAIASPQPEIAALKSDNEELRQILDAEHEPAAWIVRHPRFCGKFTDDKEIAEYWGNKEKGCTVPLYLHPQPAPEVALVEPVVYLRKDQLRQVQRMGPMLGEIADSPRVDRVPAYIAPSTEQVERWRHDSEDLEALHNNLDDAGTPRHDSSGIEYSEWGRVIQYAKAAAQAEAAELAGALDEMIKEADLASWGGYFPATAVTRAVEALAAYRKQRGEP